MHQLTSAGPVPGAGRRQHGPSPCGRSERGETEQHGLTERTTHDTADDKKACAAATADDFHIINEL